MRTVPGVCENASNPALFKEKEHFQNSLWRSFATNISCNYRCFGAHLHLFIQQIESVILMLLERLSLLEEGLNSNKSNREDNDTNLTKTVYNGMDYEVPVKDTSEENYMKNPNKKKRK